MVNIVGFVFTVYINRKRIYRGDNMVNTNKSSSHEQQKAEIIIAPMVENWLGCSVVRNAKVVLSDGVHIEPNLYSEEDKIICEIYAYISVLKVGQQNKNCSRHFKDAYIREK